MLKILHPLSIVVFYFTFILLAILRDPDKQKDYKCIKLKNNPIFYGKRIKQFIFNMSISMVSI
jgi:hypothetical protein